MPPIKIRLRRGKDEQKEAYTPEKGEPIFIEDLNQLRVGDGFTPGGHLVVGNVVVVQQFNDLPDRPKGWRHKLIKWLGGESEFNVGYVVAVQQFVIRDYKSDCTKGWSYLPWQQSVRFVERLDMFLQKR